MTRYPVYVISKGRPRTCHTSKALTVMGIRHFIVVEPSEWEEYAGELDISLVDFLVLPSNFSELGNGSIPVRNWVWEHSIDRGDGRHWILDDNISRFSRMNNNLQVYVECDGTFRAAEDFVDRYTNVALAGFQYDHFARAKRPEPAFRLNTRIYSCTLVNNSIPHRWRGRYNEDTDISIRVLQDGWVTVLFYAFTQHKATTMTMRGGNTDELYVGDGRKLMAESLQQQHPDIVKVVRKFGRWHHHVDYSGFAGNQLERVDCLPPIDGIDNYGMVLKHV